MSVFVNYGGPKLDKKQKLLVRSQAMVAVRGQQRKARGRASTNVTVLSLNPRRLAPDLARDDHSALPEEDPEQARLALASQLTTRSSVSAPKTSRRHDTFISRRAGAAGQRPNPYDLRGAPRHSTHMTGVDARTFQDYLCRCGSYSSYLDEAFVLVGFRQPSYFRPDMSKAACIYIGWLLTAGVLDAFRGTTEICYPYYEYLAVKELQKFIDGANARELHEVVYPIVILGMFEMVRFSPRTTSHLAAVEMFIKSRGGLREMPDLMQHIVIMADILHCVCLDTPLAFNVLDPVPPMHLQTSAGFFAGNQLLSCPLLLCDSEDFSLAMQYVNPAIGVQLAGVLQSASSSFSQFFHLDARNPFEEFDLPVDLDTTAKNPNTTNNTSDLLLETCVLAARIMRRTVSENLVRFDHPGNQLDVLTIYDNIRFIGLKEWAGLPYVYVWVNLIGFAASTDERMRSYFVAEVVRSAFSYGCYQMEVFQAVLMNFLHLRNGITCRNIARAVPSGSNDDFFV